MRFLQSLRFRAEAPRQLPFHDQAESFARAKTEYLINHTSNVIKISQDGTHYFFKEAKRRPRSLRDCVDQSIDCFFEEIVHNPSLKDRTLASLQCKTHFNRLVRMGSKSVRTHRLHRYLTDGNEALLGLPAPDSEQEKAQLRMLVFYLYGELQNWFCNAGVKAGELQTFCAVRALGTQELARLLGLEELIVRCDFVKIELSGKVRYGVLSQQAAGEPLTDCPCEQRARSMTPQLLRALTNLNLLDVLSHDNDHRVGNYFVLANDASEYCAVLSYDNDSPDTFGMSCSVRFSNLLGCSPFLDGKGMINRPFLDQKAAQALLHLEKSHLKALSPYLGRLQLCALWLRIRQVKKAIIKTQASRPDLLLEQDQWGHEQIRQELSGKYGKTYLASLLTDCYYETGLHEFDTL